MQENITKRSVDALEFSPSCDYFVWDGKLTGFGVRVTERTGKDGEVHRRKTFVVGLRPKGSKRYQRLTLGKHGTLTVEQAREEAAKHLHSGAIGNDPRANRRASRVSKSVKEVGTEYFKFIGTRRKKRTVAGYRWLWDKHVVPRLGALSVRDVSKDDVRRLHESLSATPYVGNRVLALVGAFFTFVATRGGRAEHENPARGVDKYEEVSRERFLNPKEFAKLGAALIKAEREGLPPAPVHRGKPLSEATAKHRPKVADTPIPANPYAVAAIRLLLLTGCREREILTLKWDAVDLERGHLRLEDTKTGKSIRPLGQAAAAVLSAIPRRKGNPYVLPGANTGKHLQEIGRVWGAVRYAAKLDDVRLHDLRHSFASVPASSGESLLVIRSLLGHRDVSTTQKYAHLGDDPAKRAADSAASSIAAWMVGSVNEAARYTR